MVNAWEVKPEVIVKCFKHIGMNPEENQAEEDDDPFAGEGLLDSNELVEKFLGRQTLMLLHTSLMLTLKLSSTSPVLMPVIQPGEGIVGQR